jgi:hypothetical protein
MYLFSLVEITGHLIFIFGSLLAFPASLFVMPMYVVASELILQVADPTPGAT